MMFRTLALGFAVMVVVAAVAPGQVGPPRDAAPASRTGTSILRGRVVDAQTNQPLRRVRLNLTASDIPQQQAISVSTDADGRYEFTELPARQFTLTARRSGYLQLRYGQRRPNEQGKVVDVGEGAVVDGIDFALPKMASISGRITDELGDPIAGVWVAAMRMTWFQNRRQMGSPTGSPLVTTDEEGEYRITGLLPGTYVVLSKTMERWSVETSGRDETMSYAPTYFPGVADLGQAVRVTVAAGQELRNADFPVVPARAATISGRALDAQGRPLRGVTLSMRFPGCCGGGVVGSGGNVAVVAPDGTFTIAGVPPGNYDLQAAGNGELAILPITVNGVDINGVELTTSPGWGLRGSIVTESGAPPGLRPSQVTIAPVRLVTGGLGMQGAPVVRPVVNTDWTFSVSNVVGPARLRVTVPDGWAVKSVMRGDRDVIADVIELRSGEEAADMRIVITDRVAAVNGQLVDAKKAPLPDGTVLLFPADRVRWFEASPFVRAARPDQQGRYRIANVVPGEYLTVAVDYVEDGQWNDAEYLDSLRRHARGVTLTAGSTQALSLSVVTP